MPLPKDLVRWERALDPSDRRKYAMQFGAGTDPLLPPNVTIASFTLALVDDAAEHGLRIIDEPLRSAAVTADGKSIVLWFEIEQSKRGNPVFSGPGVTLGVEATLQTNEVPAETIQRTFGLLVKDQ